MLSSLRAVVVMTALCASLSFPPAHERPGSIVGTVMYLYLDGESLPGASVQLDNGKKAQRQATYTRRDGSYRFDNVDSGSYRLIFSLQGFLTVACRNVVVENGAQTSMSTLMTVGPIAEPDSGPSAEPNDLSGPDRPSGPQICLGNGVVPIAVTTWGEQQAANFSFVIAVDTLRSKRAAEAFLQNVAAHAYDETLLTRVDAMIQARAKRAPDAFPSLAPDPHEAMPLKHKTGTLAFASELPTGLATSKFTILLKDDKSLDTGNARFAGRHDELAFGYLVTGLEGFRRLPWQTTIASARIPAPFDSR